jgi:transmembrane sensor
MTDNHDSHWAKIAGKLHGELSNEEEAEFNQLISDSSNLHEFEKAQKIAQNLAKSGKIPVNGKVKSWEKVENDISTYKLHWIKEAIKYAAIIAVAFIAGNLLRPKVTTDQEIRYSEIKVPFGQMSQVTLSDGTKIWLNSGTTLRYPEQFGEKSRSVSVDGEAFFQVAKMKDNPFTVNSAEMKVEVLGTSFNLSAYKEDAATSVTLVEGKVAIRNSEGKTIANLSPGQMSIKNKDSNTLDIKKVETAFFSAWTDGKIYFDDERLDQIAVKLERWFNVEISFDNEKLKAQRFTGTILKNKPVDQIMQALELLSSIRFNHKVNANGKDKISIYNKN